MKIGIIGAGAWGTALSYYYSAYFGEENVIMWTRNQQVADDINSQENSKYLPLPPSHRLILGYATTNKTKFNNFNSDFIFLTIPSQNLREVLMDGFELDGKNLIICAKGIENSSLKFMHEVVEEMFPNANIAVLSGPNLAHEIVKDLPTNTLIASRHVIFKEFADQSSSDNFKFHFSEDIIGAQIFGACKNILAIGCGIVRGLEIGDNGFAAFLNSAFEEVNELNLALGGKAKTAFSPAGLGDTILTCISQKSRNNSLGREIVANKDKSVKEILEFKNLLTEGYMSAKPIYELIRKHELSLPIIESIYKILYQNENVDIIKKLNWL